MIKTLVLSLSIVFLLISVGCRSSKSGAQSLPQPLLENHSAGDYVFPQGVYYAFDFGQNSSVNVEVDGVLAGLRDKHFRPMELWYKPGASSCTPPSSDLSMTVIVEPVLLLRFKKPQPGIEKLGYLLVEEPSAGSCAYMVKRYSF